MLAAGGKLPTTGLRRVTEQLAPVPESGNMLLTRTGNIVTVIFDLLKFGSDASGFTNIFSTGVGFRPPNNVYTGDGNSGGYYMLIYASGNVRTDVSNRSTIKATLTYPTTDSWPSNLPGTAA